MNIPTWRKVLAPILIVTSALLIVIFIGQSIANGVNRLKWKNGTLTTEEQSEETVSTDTEVAEVTTTAEVTEATTEEQPDEGYLLMVQGRNYLWGFGEGGYSQEMASECLNQAAERGNAEAWYYLGHIHERSADTDRYEQAMACYDKAIELGAVIGYSGKGDLYRSGLGVEQNRELAHSYYEQAANAGCLLAYTDLGWDYAYGSGVEQNQAQAMQYLEAALVSDDPVTVNYAYTVIGGIYKDGYNGAEPDYGKAMEYYQLAADNGYRKAMGIIGDRYYYATGVEQDYAAALEWYDRAAGLGQVSAINTVGYMYEKGLGTEQDSEAAFTCYERAAALGEAWAMANLSFCYRDGMGTEIDYAKSMEWAQNAVIGGNARAFFVIGYLYDAGLGVEQNEDIALDYYMKNIEKEEYIVSIWNIFIIYRDRGDVEAARSWAERGLAAATAQGDQTYIDKFNEELSLLP